jgi:hypothetical protein
MFTTKLVTGYAFPNFIAAPMGRRHSARIQFHLPHSNWEKRSLSPFVLEICQE